MNFNYYNGISGIYFNSVISNVIKIGNLDNTKKIILDFGCGSKVLNKKLTKSTVLNYDIDPNWTEHNDYKHLSFDVVVFNHILMYMDKKEIVSTFENIKKINKNCEFIVGMGKGSLITKLAAFASLNFSAHTGTLTTQQEQIEILNDYTEILNVKKNIFFLTDIFYTKFKI